VEGFTLVETLLAMIVLTFGLLAVGQLIAASVKGTTLARSKGSASMVAQDKIDFLADAYRQNPNGTDLALGTHGPEQVDVLNPTDGSTVNRYNVQWTVSDVADPRPGKLIKAKQVMVTVTPIGSGTTVNMQTSLNKVITITSIFSPRGT
jgi:Tfp pilus assembly protein PilV